MRGKLLWLFLGMTTACAEHAPERGSVVRLLGQLQANGPGELTLTLAGETQVCRDATCEVMEIADLDDEDMREATLRSRPIRASS